jgi:hypothetical protein
VHRGRRQHAHDLHAVAQHHLIERQFADDFHSAPGWLVATAGPYGGWPAEATSIQYQSELADRSEAGPMVPRRA